MENAHVVLRNVSRIYPGGAKQPPVHALGPLDLQLSAGEFFSVVGPSGCGKSTLLEVIAGLAPASEGTITFEGKPVEDSVPTGIGPKDIRGKL